MQIAQFQKNSFIDYPGKIACVIYTQGCNMCCEFCHNKELIPQTEPANPILWDYILNFLSDRKDLIEAVVFTGGEPTIQPDLVDRIQEIINLGFKVGLHTNGTGQAFEAAAPLCDYILLSKHSPAKIKIAKQAGFLNLSTVLWDKEKQDWHNEIIPAYVVGAGMSW